LGERKSEKQATNQVAAETKLKHKKKLNKMLNREKRLKLIVSRRARRNHFNDQTSGHAGKTKKKEIKIPNAWRKCPGQTVGGKKGTRELAEPGTLSKNILSAVAAN